MQKRILLIDDEQGICEVITHALQRPEYKIMVLHECLTVSEIAFLFPDIILLDLWLPGINGKEMTKMLKHDPHTQSIPIIMISAHSDIPVIAQKAGASDFLIKPFDIEALERKIAFYL